MNSNEILNKYINLIDKGYCSDCNELNCIDNFPHSKITHAIRELQQENKKYKEVIDKAIEYINHFSKESEVKIYGLPKCKVFIGDIEQLLEILKEVSE